LSDGRYPEAQGSLLDVVGVIGAALPVLAIIVAIACFFMFRSTTSTR
jgi:hypothetical protein